MKKLFAASLLSISLCVSQAGGAWASTHNNLPLQVNSEEVDIGPQNAIVAGVIAGLIVAIITELIIPEIVDWLSGNDDDIYGACDFYEEHRTDYDTWSHPYMQELGYTLWDSRKCDHLFDEQGNDFDEYDNCYIWEPRFSGPHTDDYDVCGP